MHDRETLVTFGCSWVYGVGLGYTKDMTLYTYKKHAQNKESADKYSFRGILSSEHNLTNVNYARAGASNGYNFSKITEIFAYKESREEFINSNPVVLWGITSTARVFFNGEDILFNELDEDPASYFFLEPDYVYSSDDANLILESLERDTVDIFGMFTRLYVRFFYNHDNETKLLFEQMMLWNIIFEFYNIPVIWFDTFNTHEYNNTNPNLIDGEDLLTQMLERENIKYSDKWYHLSNWRNDGDRITAGIKHDLLNPHSKHPTIKGHKILANILSPYIKKSLN